MNPILDRLEAQVARAVEAIAGTRAVPPAPRDLPSGDTPAASQTEIRCRGLADEVAQLRSERAQLREKIRGLIREIDRTGL